MNNQTLNLKDLFFKVFEFFGFLKKNIKTISVFLLLALLIGAFADYEYVTKKEYKSEIKFILETEGNAEPNPLAGLASSLGLGSTGASSYLFSGENFKELIKTEIVIRRALFTKVKWGNKQGLLANLILEKGHLNEAPYFEEMPKDFLQFRFKSTQLDSLTDMEMYNIYTLTNYLKSVSSVNNTNAKSSIQTLSVVTHNDSLSNIWSKQYLESISDYYIATKTKKTSEMVNLMKDRVDSLRSALYYTQGRLAQFSDQNQQIIFQRARVTAERLQLNSAQLQQLYAESLRNYDNLKFSLLKETPLINIVSKSDFPSIIPEKRFGKITCLALVIGFMVSLLFLFIRNLYLEFKHAER